jgi:hypothetical protein
MSTKYIQTVFEAQVDKSTVESSREITFVLASEATGRKHRNKYIYNWSAWQFDNYNANPIVGYQHNVYGDNMCLPPNPDDVIGKSSAWMDTYKGDRVLMSKATFEPAEINATAEKVFRKILWGSLRSVSVGVLPTGPVKNEIVRNDAGEAIDMFEHLPGQELAEWSVVNIPADPAALRRSMKNHTVAALSFVQRLMEDLSISDIKSMKVQDILDAFDKKYSSAPLEQLELELRKPDPNFEKYKAKLQSFKK